MAACLPGLSIKEPVRGDRLTTVLRVKVGPILAEFDGQAQVRFDPHTRSGFILGVAQDTRSASQAQGHIQFQISPELDSMSSKVSIELGYALTGPLAQFSRASIVKDIAKKMTESFAVTLKQDLSDQGQRLPDSIDHRQRPAPEAFNAGGLLWSVLTEKIDKAWRAVKSFFYR